jgi:hypothetical protein
VEFRLPQSQSRTKYLSGDIKEQIFSKASESGGRLRVRSALNPILWLCGLISIPTLAAGAFHPIPPWVAVIGCSPVVAALFGFLFLLLFDRDKLQSEDFQLKKRTMELAQQKGEFSPNTIEHLDDITKPKPKSIAPPPETRQNISDVKTREKSKK